MEGQPKCFDALLAEESATAQREAQVRQTKALGDLPLVVLTHGIANAAPPGVAPDQAAQTEQTWQDLQKKLAGLSTRIGMSKNVPICVSKPRPLKLMA